MIRSKILKWTRRPGGGEGERGAVLLIVALALPMLLAMTGLVVDLGQLFVVRTKLQATADATALAAASQLPNESLVRAVAHQYAELNYSGHGSVVEDEDIVLGLWQAGTFTPLGSDAFPGGTEPNAVRVAASRVEARDNGVRLIFGGFVGQRWGNVGTFATATYGDGPSLGCIYQMDPSGKPGFEISSNSHVVANCGVKVNATNRCESLEITSHSSLEAESIDVASSCTKIEGSTVSPEPNTGAGQAEDPLASMEPPPVPSSCDHNDRKIDSDGNTNVQPGVYCKGLNVTGSKTQVTMEPGLYIMKGGGFNIESGATILGDGVTIYNTCNLSGGCTTSNNDKDAEPVEITSGSTANLSAPSSGPWQGILFFQDPLMDPDIENEFSSGVNTLLDGVLYFPTQHVMFHSGTSATGTLNVILVAGTLEVSSGSWLDIAGTPTNPPAGLGERTIQLVQ